MFETGWSGVVQLLALIWGLAMLAPAGVYLIPRAINRAQIACDRENKVINGSVSRGTAVAVREPDPTEE